MKTLNSKKTKTNFSDFALSTLEMIRVRGGEGDSTTKIPPIKI
jgi:hypothetical protein